MADGTLIEWTDASWQPITGCSIVSKGCTNCYAMKLAGTRLKHIPSRVGLTKDTNAGPVWTGEVRFNEEWLDQPLRWKRPRKIFVCAHGDLFAEGVPDEWIDKVFAVMALCPQHVFQVLTKRPERMRDYLADWTWRGRIEDAIDNSALGRLAGDHYYEAVFENGETRVPLPLSNVWLGISAEDQATADERIALLLATPAVIRFVSAEPLLGRINFVNYLGPPATLPGRHVKLRPGEWIVDVDGAHVMWRGIDWIIVGGESGPNARPMHPDWARSIRDQCTAAGVAFFFKQWGEWGPDDGPPPDAPDRVFEGRAACAWWDGDAWHYEKNGYGADLQSKGEWVYHLGKKAAGRLLDSREWNELPEPRP